MIAPTFEDIDSLFNNKSLDVSTPESNIPELILMQWYGYTNLIEHCVENKKIGEELVDLLYKNGFCTIELKRFATSEYYPNPNRSAFSYFYYFLCVDFDKDNEIIMNLGIEVAGIYKHSTFNYKDLHVQNH